ncbi:MAG: type 4a pilus biogenesis protein PilO [Gammaproteobacteria bacterium]|nr:type 4a pilus biogenesis protein PilO [Gammaproteobacteria bacterium]
MKDLLEQLKALDINDIGRWPFVFRAAVIVLLFVAVVAGGFYMKVVREEMPRLERAEREEIDLRRNFETRQRQAANLDAYRVQLEEMERSFGTMLRQLPNQTEVPNLLVDISQTGLAAGLEERLFQPSPEVRRDFYAELPISIRLVGSYHEMGEFVSGIAALPRIVTLHDIQITREGDRTPTGKLVLDVTAKTYRYLDEAGE